MGENSDKASGRIKQAAGALTGDDDTKREGEREERKGEIKEKINDATDAAKDGLDDIKDIGLARLTGRRPSRGGPHRPGGVGCGHGRTPDRDRRPARRRRHVG